MKGRKASRPLHSDTQGTGPDRRLDQCPPVLTSILQTHKVDIPRHKPNGRPAEIIGSLSARVASRCQHATIP